MVYQEDVIKVAHYFAGLSLAEADVLRRGMSGKSRSRMEFERIREAFFVNCAAKGYEEAVAREVWRQMESFSGYSFSKAHSASFAVESYQSLYLKTYYPLEFMVAELIILEVFTGRSFMCMRRGVVGHRWRPRKLMGVII
jgi:DNA polymerase-3 subunit alpha